MPNRQEKPPSPEPSSQVENAGPEEIDFSKFEGIGLSPKAGWYASAALYGTGGIMFTLLWLVLDAVPTGVGAISLFSVAAAPLCLIGARVVPDAAWGAHVRILGGMTIIGVGGIFAGDTLSGLVLIMVYPLLATAFLHAPRISIPYAMAGTAYVAFGLIAFTNDPAAHAVTTTAVIFAIGVATINSQHALRKIAMINHRLSVVDPLTGTANVRRLRGRIHEAIVSSERSGVVPALFTIDLDDFKEVNDRFSHTVGDQVLKAVASELQAELEPGDLIARRGGDEFSILTLHTPDRSLTSMQEGLSKAIHRARMRTCAQVNPHGSVGFVIYESGEAVDDMLRRGDDALHEAKLQAHPERRALERNAFGELGTAAVLQMQSYRRRGDRRATGEPAVPARAATHRVDHPTHGSQQEIEDELEMARWVKTSLGSAPVWKSAAAMTYMLGLTLVGVIFAGLTSELKTTTVLLAVGGILLVAFGCAFAARKESPVVLLDGALIITVALLTVVILSASSSRYSLVDLYLVPIVCAFYGLSPKRALPYFIACSSLYAGMLISAEYQYTATRIGVTMVIVTVMIAMLAKARQTTRDFAENAVGLSVVDPLTGIANLRGLRRGVADEIERCSVTGQRIALLAIDLDDFKSVNDRYSHALGDEVLVNVSRAMSMTVRIGDLVARRGGDEFAVVCAIETEKELVPIMLRLADQIEAERAQLCTDIVPTASIGSVIWQPGETCDGFLERADAELHGAKVDSHEQRSALPSRETA